MPDQTAQWPCLDCDEQIDVPFTIVLDPFSSDREVNGLVSVDSTPFREHVAAHGHYIA